MMIDCPVPSMVIGELMSGNGALNVMVPLTANVMVSASLPFWQPSIAAFPFAALIASRSEQLPAEFSSSASVSTTMLAA